MRQTEAVKYENGDAENSFRESEPTHVASSSAPPSSIGLFALSATFFLCMVVVEVTMEATTTLYSHLDSLTSAITLFQFGFCVGLPAAVQGVLYGAVGDCDLLQAVLPALKRRLAAYFSCQDVHVICRSPR